MDGIRQIEPGDAEAVADLTGQLGYPVDACTMRQRIQSTVASPDRVTYVACEGPAVVGWVDVFVVHHLQAGVSAEIGGLVVSDVCRGMGIGAQLLRRAEDWARARGLDRVVVRSRSTREAAHRFYLREGYEQTKTSAVFVKSLLPAESRVDHLLQPRNT